MIHYSPLQESTCKFKNILSITGDTDPVCTIYCIYFVLDRFQMLQYFPHPTDKSKLLTDFRTFLYWYVKWRELNMVVLNITHILLFVQILWDASVMFCLYLSQKFFLCITNKVYSIFKLYILTLLTNDNVSVVSCYELHYFKPFDVQMCYDTDSFSMLCQTLQIFLHFVTW